MVGNIISAASSAIYVSVACTLVSLLMQGSVFKTVMKYVCGLCVLMSVLAILSPVLKSLTGLASPFPDNSTENENTDTEYNDRVTVQSARYICKYVKTAVSQRFDIESELIAVSVTVDTENKDGVMMKSVTVTLPSERADIFSAVAEYVSSLVGSGCMVVPKQ